MKYYEKKILDKRLPDFMEEVIPVELLPYLSCLQKTDKEVIEARQRNEGPTRANYELVDRLKRRDKGFQNFVQALRKCGSEHTALLLDPYYKVGTENDEVADTDGSGVGFKRIGTAIDVTIKGNLLPPNSEEQPEGCSELEAYLAKKFENHSSDDSKEMRKELQKHLPQGAVFVNTAKGSIIATFRLSSEEAAKELWKMYTEEKFQTMLQTVLVEKTLAKEQKIPDEPLELRLSLREDKFHEIQEKLAEIESQQDIADCLRSSLSSEQEGKTGDDEHEIEIDIPPVFLGSNGNSFGKRELKLREYQKELAAPAIQGNNTIICAPTNSGKTYVAIDIAKKHLDSFSTEDTNAATGGEGRKVPKVVFIVSTVNLVFQQKERFQDFLRHKYRVGDISGNNATEIPLKYLLKNNDVVVLTAQILVNALNSNISEERVQLSDISLLLFDECHHADKEHSYNRIMEKYLALKNQAGKQHKLPQIVGFTASLGTGKAQSVEKAEKHILLVSANLDAKVISTVKNNEEELKKFANVPKRKMINIPKTNQDPFEKIVSQVMDKIEALIKKPKGKSYKPGPPDKAGQQYRQWVEELYKESIAEGDRFLVTYSEQLREYHVALTINASTTMKNAKTRLQKYFDSLNEDKFLFMDAKLKKLFECAMTKLEKHVKEHGEPENPLLMQLKELLLENYEDVKPQEDGETSKAKESQKENGAEEKNAETVNGVENGGKKDGHENNGETAVGTNNVTEVADVASHGDVNATADEADDDKAEVNEEHNKGKLQDEEIVGHLADNTEENGNPSDDKPRQEEEDNGDNDEASQNENEAEGNIVENEQDATTVNGEETSKNEDGNASNADANTTDTSKANEHTKQTDRDEESSSPSADNKQDDKPCENGGKKEWKGPKGILFTRTRESTEALVDWIKETKELNAVIRPEPLVGSGDGNIGMTQHEQERAIRRFHTGEKNLLLATSVAEEGLDIRDCNYVIRYDMMGNEISTVQSRGRVRADEGKYSVLAGQDSGALKREFTSSFRESLMIEALSHVQSMDPETFERQVKAIQQKNFQDRYIKKHLFATMKSVHLPHDVTFRCRKCNMEACQAHDIRTINGSYHVVINSDFKKSKVDIKKHPNPKTFDGIVMNQKIYCKDCHEDWGVTALITRVEWMCIKICSFVLEFPGQSPQRRMFKKWKDLPFCIDEATIEELLQQARDGAPDDIDFDLSL